MAVHGSQRIDARVSVALCTYNGARFLPEQLRSIAAQTLLPAELVVSDDGSTDDTVQIVEAFAERALLPVRLVRNSPALGTTKNFEAALAQTTGSILVLSDQDDSWHENRIERAVAVLDADPHNQLVFSDARLVDGDGAPLGYGLLDSLSARDAERSALVDGRSFEVLLRRNLVTGATAMFRRELFDVARPFPEEWVHDEWLAMLAAVIGRAVLLPEELVDYRLHGGNQIGTVEPTLAYKMRRMLQPGRQRNQDIAAATRTLAHRLETMPGAEASLEQVRGKLGIERFRADLPSARWRRVLPVLRRAATGEYERFTSQGRLDVVRDLVQPD